MAGFYESRGYTLDQAKAAFAGEIEVLYSAACLDVFDSSATGMMRRYYCDEASQLRMVNGRVANVGMTMMCGVPPVGGGDPTYDWLPHTSAECGKLHSDYVAFSAAAFQTRQSRLAQLAACTSVQQVDVMFNQLLYVYEG